MYIFKYDIWEILYSPFSQNLLCQKGISKFTYSSINCPVHVWYGWTGNVKILLRKRRCYIYAYSQRTKKFHICAQLLSTGWMCILCGQHQATSNMCRLILQHETSVSRWMLLVLCLLVCTVWCALYILYLQLPNLFNWFSYYWF